MQKLFRTYLSNIDHSFLFRCRKHDQFLYVTPIVYKCTYPGEDINFQVKSPKCGTRIPMRRLAVDAFQSMMDTRQDISFSWNSAFCLSFTGSWGPEGPLNLNLK